VVLAHDSLMGLCGMLASGKRYWGVEDRCDEDESIL
jgi:hypothetical protein